MNLASPRLVGEKLVCKNHSTPPSRNSCGRSSGAVEVCYRVAVVMEKGKGKAKEVKVRMKRAGKETKKPYALLSLPAK